MQIHSKYPLADMNYIGDGYESVGFIRCKILLISTKSLLTGFKNMIEKS